MSMQSEDKDVKEAGNRQGTGGGSQQSGQQSGQQSSHQSSQQDAMPPSQTDDDQYDQGTARRAP